MKAIFTSISMVLFLPLLCFGQNPVESKMYSWKAPTNKSHGSIYSSVIFEGVAHDMAYIQISANAINPAKKKTSHQVPANEEELLLVKEGTLTLTIKDSTWSLGGGSVALLLPGEKYSIHNTTTDSCTYYTLKYRSKLPIDVARGNRDGGSLVREWNSIKFRPHDKGGIRNYFERATPMCKRLEMHVTTLKEGIRSHDPHTHAAEEIVLVIENKTEMQIGDRFYKGDAGDLYYLGSNVSHAIRNVGSGTCTYFAFQFE